MYNLYSDEKKEDYIRKALVKPTFLQTKKIEQNLRVFFLNN